MEKYLAPLLSSNVVDNTAQPMYLEDAQLGVRPNPHYADHDGRGWRNPSALGDVSIVALGDSQTYGLGVKQSQSWPSQLSEILHQPVYQIAFGGYNPTTFLRLKGEIFSHNPKIVILSIYFGANFQQAFDDVYLRAKNSELLKLRSSDANQLLLFKKASKIDGDQWVRARYLDCQRPLKLPHPALGTVENILDAPLLLPLIKDKTAMDSFWEVAEAYSRVVRDIKKRVDMNRNMQPPPICIRYENNNLRAILTPAYRLLNLEITDPRIREGERLVVASALRLAELAAEHGAKLFVLLVPTKELVFQYEPNDVSEDLHYLIRLWKLETAARGRVSKELRTHNVHVIDGLPPLRALVADGLDPYMGLDGNGHPTEVGYGALAKAVSSAIGEVHN